MFHVAFERGDGFEIPLTPLTQMKLKLYPGWLRSSGLEIFPSLLLILRFGFCFLPLAPAWFFSLVVVLGFLLSTAARALEAAAHQTDQPHSLILGDLQHSEPRDGE